MHNIKIGDKDVKFVRSGGEVVYPNYVKDGLVLWYDFSGMENSGVNRGVAEDLSGNGNDGVLENFAFDAGSGYADNGLEFDGVDDWVETPNKPSLHSEDISLSVVFINNSADTSYKSILNKRGSYSDGYFLFLSPTNELIFDFGGSTRRWETGYFINVSSTPVQVIITRDNNGIKLFINGLFSSSENVAGAYITTSAPMTIGMGLNLNPYFFKSNIKSTQIYNRLLTPEEIAHNYKIDKHRFNIQD